jgi:hypothetical protein
MANFTNNKIKDTYQRVLQIDGGVIQDGLGIPVTISSSISASISSTASYISPTFISASAASSGFGSGGGSGLLTTASFNSYTGSNTSQFAGTASFAFTSSFAQGGNGSFSGSFTGSLFGTASWASNSLTSSFITGSNVFGPFGSNSITSASFAVSSSRAISSSFASTASYALNGGVTQIVAGTNVTITNGGSGSVTINAATGSGSGSGTPGGSNREIQFNSGSAFSGSAAFRFIYASQSLEQGFQTTASGSYSHAEGGETQASGEYSHAEGQYTLAIGTGSHAEGYQTKTGTQNAYYAQSVVSGSITLSGTYGDVTSEFSKDSILYLYDEPFDNNYTRATFIISQSYYSNPNTIVELYDTGINTTTAYVGNLGQYIINWAGDQTIPGEYSHAEGYQTQAIGEASHTEGWQTQAIGQASHAEGQTTQAIGEASHTEGEYTIAQGNASHAEGAGTYSIGYASHAEGSETNSIGEFSHAEGYQTQAIGTGSHAEGYQTKTGTQNAYYAQSVVSGSITLSGSYGNVTSSFVADSRLYLYDDPFDNIYSRAIFIISQSYYSGSTNTIVELYDTSVITTTAYVGDINYGIYNWTGDQTISGDASHAEGNTTQAIGDASHAEGRFTIAIGDASHAEGYETLAIGFASHAEGWQTQAIGTGSHAEGQTTQAIGILSHAEGYDTQAIGIFSHAEGYQTQAIGILSHADGVRTQAIGTGSHTEGNQTTASGDFQHVQGRFNITSSVEGAFIIGNGTSNASRSNLIYAHDSAVEITGSLLLNDILVLAPRTTTPTPSAGMLIVSGSGANQHIYCYLNSTWKQLD